MVSISERTCSVCKTKKPKGKLVRWVIIEGKPKLDAKKILSGRGYYCCKKHKGNIDKFIKIKKIKK